MEEIGHRAKRGSTRRSRHIPRSRRVGSRLWQPTQLRKARPRVRSTRLAIAVSCHIGTASIHTIHGSSTLRITQAQDARINESPHDQRKLHQINVTVTSTKSPTHSELNKNSEK